MINDNDCYVEVPMLKDDLQSEADPSRNSISLSQSISPFLSTLRVIREIANLLKTLKAPTILPSTLEFHDLQFNHCMASFPAHHQTQREGHLDPHDITALLHLQNARLLLHRHNLSILCAPETRLAAIDKCLQIAKDTSQILERYLNDSPKSPNKHPSSQHAWAWLFKTAVHGFTCTHIWRCTLFLCLRGNFLAALTCVRVSAIVGDARPVNMACGKYVAFFVDHLTQKWHHDSAFQVDKDEETIAYVSGDIQGSHDHSWVWEDDEDFPAGVTFGPVAVAPADKETTVISGTEADDYWGQAGWEVLIEKLERLCNQNPLRNRSTHSLPQATTGDTDCISPVSKSAHPPSLSTASSRISIANIM